jgi:hypothetical protein
MLMFAIAVISAMTVDGFLFSPARAVAGAGRCMCLQMSSGRQAIYPKVPSEAVSRKQFLVGAAVAILWNPQLANAQRDDDDGKAAEAAAKAARAEAVKRKIEASKQKYRTASKLLQERKGVDYSCVAATGSPCPARKQNDAAASETSKTDK